MPTRVKGCSHCSRRRINCDRTEPHCNKCVRAGLECSGLGTYYRWAKPMKPSTLQRSSRRSSPARSRAVSHSSAVGSAPNARVQQVRLPEAGTLVDEAPSVSTLMRGNVSVRTPIYMVPSTRPDAWTINYFIAEVSRWICPTKRSRNEFQALLSPFAMERSEVFSAIAATAYHRLAYYGNEEFNEKAEHYKSKAIAGLLQDAQQIRGDQKSQHSQMAALAVIVVMIYDDMVSAQNYFRVLLPIMRTLYRLIDFTTLQKNNDLGVFLAEQIGLLTVLSLPYYNSPEDQRDMKQYALQFLSSFGSKNDRHPNGSFLAFCLQQCVSVWSQNIEQPGANVDGILEDLKARLDDFGDLQDLDHYLTWVYFISAAASSTPLLKGFFKGHLQKHVDAIGFKNMPLMIDLLDHMPQEKWSMRLQDHSEYICA